MPGGKSYATHPVENDAACKRAPETPFIKLIINSRSSNPIEMVLMHYIYSMRCHCIIWFKILVNSKIKHRIYCARTGVKCLINAQIAKTYDMFL